MALPRQHSSKNSQTELHGNPTNGLDSASRTERTAGPMDWGLLRKECPQRILGHSCGDKPVRRGV